MSRKLVTLKSNVPVKDELSSFILKDINKENLYNFLREMEFNRLLSQAISFYGDNKKLAKNTENKATKIDTNSYKSIISENDLDKLIKKLNEKSIISVDCETTSLSPMDAELVGVSFCCGTNEAYYIPVGHKNVKSLSKEFVIKKIKKILEDVSIKKIGQNIKYDLIILQKYGINIEPIEDTMLLSYTLRCWKQQAQYGCFI